MNSSAVSLPAPVVEADEQLVETSISARGLAGAHIIRYNLVPNLEAWREKIVPGELRELCTHHYRYEEDLKTYHLYLWWSARNLVQFGQVKDAPVDVCVLWWIAPGETISQAARAAAELHLASVGQAATHVWIQKMPKDAKSDIDGMVVEAGGWVPDRFVVVGIPIGDGEKRVENGE
jgi:hypothetical protein